GAAAGGGQKAVGRRDGEVRGDGAQGRIGVGAAGPGVGAAANDGGRGVADRRRVDRPRRGCEGSESAADDLVRDRAAGPGGPGSGGGVADEGEDSAGARIHRPADRGGGGVSTAVAANS